MTDDIDRRGHAEHGLMQGFPPPPDKRVTARNGLWTPPYNRWAYQHMRELLPSVPISGVAAPASLTRRHVDAIDGITVLREDGSPADMATFLDETFTDSLVVVRGDEIVWERHLNGMTPSTPHQMMSCTKSFIGLFALLAIDRGAISEHDTIGTVVPELAASAFGDATLGHLLDMTNSMAFDETYDDPAADIHEYAALVGLGAGTGGRAADLYSFLAMVEPQPGLAHGAVFHYQTPKTDVVGWATNRATERSAFDAFDALWTAIGAGRDSYVIVDPIGTPVVGGGLNATSDDLARFTMMLLADGRVGEHEVIPPSALDLIQRGGSVEAFLAGTDAIGCMANGTWTYRAQWWVRNERGREAFTAIGVNGQWIYVDRARAVAIVKLSSQPVAADTWYDDYTINAFDAVIDALA